MALEYGSTSRKNYNAFFQEQLSVLIRVKELNPFNSRLDRGPRAIPEGKEMKGRGLITRFD